MRRVCDHAILLAALPVVLTLFLISVSFDALAALLAKFADATAYLVGVAIPRESLERVRGKE